MRSCPDKILVDYLGGRGLGALPALSGHRSGRRSPLAGEPAHFHRGLRPGGSLPFSPKMVVSTKSPLTKGYLYAMSSGAPGHSIRKAGYFAIMITGKSEEPLYLKIDPQGVEFRDGRDLWGMKTIEAQSTMLKEAGESRASTAAIGPGGEKLIKYRGHHE